MKVLAVIPARGGSKGIKDKNIVDFNGVPLITKTICAAIASGVCDEVMVSTENRKIAEISKNYGAAVPFLRSESLAQDRSKTIECVVEVLEMYRGIGKEFDILILLQPTSPLRTEQDIREAFNFFLSNQRRSLVGVTETKPLILTRMRDEKGYLKKTAGQQGNSTIRRQDLGKMYVVNGAIYINNVSEITESTSFNDNEIGFVMSTVHSVDIDDEEDLELARIIDSFYSGGNKG